jgi:two-component system nitrogen regulation response regulator NtrX
VIRLAQHFVAEFSREYGRRPKNLSAAAMDILRAYRWPGNVRELRNTIERLMIMVPGEIIEPTDLAFLDVGASPAKVIAEEKVGPLFEARDAWERNYIVTALAAFDGNISRTADALGLERSNLYKKMRALGIAPSREKEEATEQ